MWSHVATREVVCVNACQDEGVDLCMTQTCMAQET